MKAVSPAVNPCAGPFGAIYDFYIERPWLMGLLGRVVWGIDPSPLYENLDAAASIDNGATILDVPCGGGIALRKLRPDQKVRYVAVDISEGMLERAARRAEAQGLNQVEFRRADMLALPFEDNTADVVLSFSGLHMVDDPERAVSELTRCLKPGGELIGTTFLREGSHRQRKIFEAGHRKGHAMPPPVDALQSWLEAGGIEHPAIEPRAGFAVFRGTRATTRQGP
jgi:ubiquinone/menaquinone biosynthesis C-methylase UbiE